jgi:PemK-like, MazF-like toxin of type II toxin-antitoxin system
MGRISELFRDTVRRVRMTVRHAEQNTGRTTRRAAPPVRAAIPGVQIEYRPQRDGDPDPGEVVWTWVPFEEDPTLGKDRPVVIVGHHGEDLSGVALTTKRSGHSNQVEVGSGAWDPKGRPSYAKVDRLLDIEPNSVRREGAALSRRRFDVVIEAISRYHDVTR